MINEKEKKRKKAHNYFRREDQIMTSSIPHGMAANKSPHFLINLWFSRMKKKTLLFKKILLRVGKESAGKFFMRLNQLGKTYHFTQKNI